MKEEKSKNDGNFIFLDLDEVELFGWERYKSTIDLAKMVRDVLKGDEFPPVYVALQDGKYVLSGYYNPDADLNGFAISNYGGHHRALAHWIAGKPLKCKITPDSVRWSRDINIKDIVIGR